MVPLLESLSVDATALARHAPFTSLSPRLEIPLAVSCLVTQSNKQVFIRLEFNIVLSEFMARGRCEAVVALVTKENGKCEHTIIHPTLSSLSKCAGYLLMNPESSPRPKHGLRLAGPACVLLPARGPGRHRVVADPLHMP